MLSFTSVAIIHGIIWKVMLFFIETLISPGWQLAQGYPKYVRTRLSAMLKEVNVGAYLFLLSQDDFIILPWCLPHQLHHLDGLWKGPPRTLFAISIQCFRCGGVQMWSVNYHHLPIRPNPMCTWSIHLSRLCVMSLQVQADVDGIIFSNPEVK